jgi:hypothetical protein
MTAMLAEDNNRLGFSPFRADQMAQSLSCGNRYRLKIDAGVDLQGNIFLCFIKWSLGSLVICVPAERDRRWPLVAEMSAGL